MLSKVKKVLLHVDILLVALYFFFFFIEELNCKFVLPFAEKEKTII